jgi:hypothetical protein
LFPGEVGKLKDILSEQWLTAREQYHRHAEICQVTYERFCLLSVQNFSGVFVASAAVAMDTMEVAFSGAVPDDDWSLPISG